MTNKIRFYYYKILVKFNYLLFLFRNLNQQSKKLARLKAKFSKWTVPHINKNEVSVECKSESTVHLLSSHNSKCFYTIQDTIDLSYDSKVSCSPIENELLESESVIIDF